MDDKEWRTFVTVVDEGNITKAAEKLFVSQPALSYRLRHLEDSVGVLLAASYHRRYYINTARRDLL